MKRQLISIILAASMSIVLVTGCGGSAGAGTANAGSAEQTVEGENKETVESETPDTANDEAQAAKTQEAVKAEEPETTTQETAVTESETTPSEGKRYLVKTEKTYTLDEKGEKSLMWTAEYEYDENGNYAHIHSYFEGDSPQGHDEYYEYETDEKGRPLKKYLTASGSEDDLTEYDERLVGEYSYSGDQYTYYRYVEDRINISETGFIRNGNRYPTENTIYTDEYPKTEDENSFESKSILIYEGTTSFKSETYDSENKKIAEEFCEYEMDENNNPIVTKDTYKDLNSGQETNYIVEKTFIEFK